MRNKTTEMKYLVSCIIFLYLLFLGNSVSSADVKFDVQASYDVSNVKFFDIKYELNMTCNVTVTPASDYKLRWYKDDVEVSKVENLKKKIIDEGRAGVHVLKVEKPSEDDYGNYTCSVLGNDDEVLAQRNFLAAGIAHVKLQPTTNVVEAEKLRLHCHVIGKPMPKIQWEVLDVMYEESSGRIQLLMDPDKKVPNAILLIEDVKMTDRGMYKCIAKNIYSNKTDAEAQSFVRVKDKLAALWPFLGICAEVFILCAIILIYEKKRNKHDLEESDTDQSPDQNDLKKVG